MVFWGGGGACLGGAYVLYKPYSIQVTTTCLSYTQSVEEIARILQEASEEPA